MHQADIAPKFPYSSYAGQTNTKFVWHGKNKYTQFFLSGAADI